VTGLEKAEESRLQFWQKIGGRSSRRKNKRLEMDIFMF